MARTTEELLQDFVNYQKDRDKKAGSSGLDLNLDSLKKSITPTAASFDSLKSTITTNVDTWRKLSSVGANFSNDVVGMSLAAVNARVSLADFADILTKAGPSLAGLGGSVTRGVEAFAKLAKEFQDTELTRDLMNLGYTTKEINDTLALNLGFQKSTMQMDQAGKEAAFTAASKLATEMDMVAKLTGKSRAEQEKSLREAQQNGEVEAKMRLIGLREGADAEKKARAEFAGQLVKAEAMGMGNLFKDMFTKGVPASEEAAVQLAMAGKAGSELSRSAAALGKGLTDESAAAMKRAEVANAALQKNEAYLQTAAVGSLAGLPGTIAKKGVEVNDALYHSIENVAKANGTLLKTQSDYAAALDKIRADLLKSQAGVDAAGKKVSGATEGIISAEKATRDAAAGIASSMEVANKSGKTIADNLRIVGSSIADAAKGFGNVRGRVAGAAEEGLKRGGTGEFGIGTAAQGVDIAASGATNVATTAVRKAGEFGKEKPLERRATGGPVDAGTPYLVGEGGKAEIFVPKAAGDIVPMDKVGTKLPPPPDPKEQMSFAESMAASVRKGMQTVGVDPNMRGNPTGGMDGFDLSSVSKDIKTSISSVVGGGSSTTTRTQDDNSKNAEKELKSIKSQYAEERTALAAKFKEMMPDASFGDRRRAMNSSDESKALEEKYASLINPLQKKIEEGIKWETDTKQSAVEETKTAIASELLIKEDQAAALERINENRKKINTDEAKSIAEQLSVYKQSNEAKTEEEKNTAAALERINANRKKINTDEIAASTAPVPIIKQDQINKPIDPESLKNKFTDDKGKINLGKLKIPGINFGDVSTPKDPKSQTSQSTTTVADSVKKEEEAKKVAAEKAKQEEAAKKAAAPGAQTAPGKPGPSSQKASTLDDVVKSLDRLNTQMGQLINQQSDLVKKQTSAMLASTSGNVYDRTR